MKHFFFSTLIFLALIAGLKAQTPKKTDFNPTTTSAITQQNKIKITGKALKIEDILVKEKTKVKAGQPLISRSLEISNLESQKTNTLERLNFLKKRVIPVPIKPIKRNFPELPVANFDGEELKIKALQSKCDRELINLENIKSSESPFLSNATLNKLEKLKQQKAKELFQAQDLLNNLKTLNFENHYISYQEEVIKKLKDELELINNDILIENGRLQEKSSINQENKINKISQAETAIAECKERLQIAQSELAQSKYNRQILEQQYSHNLAVYQQEQDKNEQIYQKDLIEYQKSLEAQKLAIFETENLLTQIESKLAEITEVKSPYDGEITRIKIIGSSDGFINLEFTLVY
jgi:biotin carboxyl carrier protein